ncbi:MAG: hypothetical protein HY581_08555 [Nitrospirae bacterium]|nr:hypothetical protein [Nitrospirota bacterium]
MVNEGKPGRLDTGKKNWVRIPDGTKVRHRQEGHEGFIDGLTEIITGPGRNPDGRTQYRIDVGSSERRKLAAEEDLLILTDHEGLAIMGKQKVDYRRHVTGQLHGMFTDDRFVESL